MAKPAKPTTTTPAKKAGTPASDDKRFACPFCTASPCVCPTGTGGSR